MSAPTLVILLELEAAPRILSTAQSESEQERLIEDLQGRADAVLEAVADVLTPETRWAA